MPRPIHFEIPAADPQKAIAFYEKVFGWKFTQWNSAHPYWVISTGDKSQPGIDGGLMLRHDPAQPCVNTIQVESVDETVKVVEAAGGQCVVPKMPIPTVGWLAYCKDVDGHIFGIMQPDAEAR
jgi:hypothetical protein